MDDLRLVDEFYDRQQNNKLSVLSFKKMMEAVYPDDENRAAHAVADYATSLARNNV
jgi:hypothetical protein